MPKKSRRGRKQGIRETSPDKILIVCEGKKTDQTTSNIIKLSIMISSNLLGVLTKIVL
jgi:hypothetical protein